MPKNLSFGVFFVIVSFFPTAKHAFAAAKDPSVAIRLEFQFVDAVVTRRMVPGLPAFDFTEILGTARLFQNGVSNDLLGQYDIRADEGNEIATSLFQSCITEATAALNTGKGFVIEGTTHQPLNGGYKTLVFLEEISHCHAQ